MKGARQTRNEIIEEMVEGLRTDILALGYAFAGLVYTKESDRQWLKRRFVMFHDILESSWSYQEIIQKGMDQGLEAGKKQGLQEGLEEGELQALRSVLTRLVGKHFPALLSLAQQQVTRLTQPDLLNVLVDHLLEARNEEQARQILVDIGNSNTSLS